MEQTTISEVTILKVEINEIVRACQMAKSGIAHTNLLDTSEIINVINVNFALQEAKENETPSSYTNASPQLYILSIPKLGRSFYSSH